MAKTLPAALDTVGADEFAAVASPIVYDGGGGLQTVNRQHNRLTAVRNKEHVTQSWIATGMRDSVGGGFTVRLAYRITPRRHTPRLRVRVNAACDLAGSTGDVRITTPAAAVTFNFAGVWAPGNEQSATVACTDTQPPTRQLVTVEINLTGGNWIDLRRLLIRDDTLVLGDMP